LIRFTPEQADALEFVMANDGILLIKAGAGTGKTFMSKQIVKELKPKSGLYTAFNKAIVQEGIERFAGTSVESKTFHALAHSFVKPTMPIESFSYKCITEKLTYAEKRLVIDQVDMFFVSASDCMDSFFDKQFKNHSKARTLTDICCKYVQGMADGSVNPTFNFMLKCLHLMMLEGTAVIKKDIVILDEINDVTAVVLEIFKLIESPKKLGLGESHQAIYQFLNLIDGFEELKNQATTMYFTQSYRCSIDIAKRINNKMSEVMDPDFKFIGTDEPIRNGLTLYCTMTNAQIVDIIYDRIAIGKGFKLLRKPAEIFAASLAVLSASQGKKPYQKKYEFLVDTFQSYKEQDKHKSYFKFLNAEVDDKEINNAIKLLLKLSSKNVSLYDLYKKAKETKVDKSFTISTVFTSKGLEFETVYIADDLNNNFKQACEGELETDEAITAMRCYYVACSRCGVNLVNSII
jgi:superfamily I DNA/RNA helicase